MQKFLSVFLSLSLFVSLFFIPVNSISAETIGVIEDTEIVEEFELTGTFEESDSSSIQIQARAISLPNAVNVTTSTSGSYVEIYATNIGVDTVDSVTATLLVQRYNHNSKWVQVRKETLTLKNLKPGKKSMGKIYNPQNYGYEKITLSFVGKDGKSVTSDSQTKTRIKNPYNWGDIKTLADHTNRHASDFGITYNEMTYSKKANEHYKNRKKKGYEYFSDSSGNIRVYQASTNSFGSYNSSGKTRTFYKPSRGKEYWEDQKAKYKK